jgi:phage-related protein
VSVIKEIIFFGDKITDFYLSQDEKVRLKMNCVFDLVRFEEQVPKKFYKKLENTAGIYEIRVITSQKSFRILCFQNQGNLIILTNGFIKKTQKMPKSEIKIAEKLKIEYLNTKNNEKQNI